MIAGETAILWSDVFYSAFFRQFTSAIPAATAASDSIIRGVKIFSPSSTADERTPKTGTANL